MKKNIKFSEHPLLLLYYSFCLSLRAPLWVRGNLVKCHCELSKKVWQSHYSFISFIFCICVISSHTYSSNYNYTLFLYANLHFPTHDSILVTLYLCYVISGTLFFIFTSVSVIPAKDRNPSFSVIASPNLYGRGNLILLYISIFYVFTIKIL